MRWVRQHKPAIAAVLGIIAFLIVVGIGVWSVLVGYVSPKTAGERKDVVQTFALIAAGLVGVLGGIVGIANLKQQRDLEEQRAQADALQAYFEQMGKLLTDYDLIGTNRPEIQQLAQAQTLTVLARLNGALKGSVVRFLQEAQLIGSATYVISLKDADLSRSNLENVKFHKAALGEVNLRKANLRRAELIDGTDLSEADLEEADLTDANLDFYAAPMGSGAARTEQPGDLHAAYERATHLVGTNLKGAGLTGANLTGVYLDYANLKYAKVTNEQLAKCKSLTGATMPDGQKYEAWLKDKEGSAKDVENE